MSNNGMKGKRVLVTGSGTGIGREIGLEFAREGASVVFHYAHSEMGQPLQLKKSIRRMANQRYSKRISMMLIPSRA